jgi:hypothetical protein
VTHRPSFNAGLLAAARLICPWCAKGFAFGPDGKHATPACVGIPCKAAAVLALRMQERSDHAG